MAKGLGTKLGDLVYASNRAPVSKLFRNLSMQTEAATVSRKQTSADIISAEGQKRRNRLRGIRNRVSGSGTYLLAASFFNRSICWR